jgi:hypothetical protein
MLEGDSDEEITMWRLTLLSHWSIAKFKSPCNFEVAQYRPHITGVKNLARAICSCSSVSADPILKNTLSIKPGKQREN